MTIDIAELANGWPRHNPEDTACPKSSGHSSLVARNVRIDGHRTSMRLEPEFWAALREVARREGRTIADICSRAARDCPGSVTSAVRVYVLKALMRA